MEDDKAKELTAKAREIEEQRLGREPSKGDVPSRAVQTRGETDG
jgi:hypothetical protein